MPERPGAQSINPINRALVSLDFALIIEQRVLEAFANFDRPRGALI